MLYGSSYQYLEYQSPKQSAYQNHALTDAGREVYFWVTSCIPVGRKLIFKRIVVITSMFIFFEKMFADVFKSLDVGCMETWGFCLSKSCID